MLSGMMVCVGIYITLFANLLLRLDESNICHLWSLPHLLHEIKTAIFFLSNIFCLSNWNVNPVSNSLDKRSSCLKYSFTSLLFWLALQKHILDHYCTVKLLFGKGHTHRKLHTKSTSWKHSSIPHLCEKALYLPSVFLSSSPGVQSLLRPFSFIYVHSTCDLNWWNVSSDLRALCTHWDLLCWMI